jgi:hypothetical protein
MAQAAPRCLLATALLAACSAAVPTPAPPPARPPAPAARAIVSPSRWFGARPYTHQTTARRALPGGRVVRGSEEGVRWIDAERAEQLLPERVAGILPVGARWAFFGASGRAYLAASPLGAIEEVRDPPAPFTRVSAGSAAAVGLAEDGSVLRTTDGGARWTRLEVPALAPAIPFDLALQSDGTGALLGAPQRVLVTADDGATWSPLALDRRWAATFEVSEEGRIWLVRLVAATEDTPQHVERFAVLRDDPPRFVPAVDAPAAEAFVPAEVPFLPARALAGRHLLQVGQLQSAGPWLVAAAPLDREPVWRALPALEGCKAAAPAAHGDELWVGCAREGKEPADAPRSLHLLRSRDGGATWEPDGEAPLELGAFAIEAGPAGAILIRNACERAGCAPLRLRPARGEPFVSLPKPPGISFSAYAFDAARRLVYGLGEGGSPGRGGVEVWSYEGRPIRTASLPPDAYPSALALDARGDLLVAAHVHLGVQMLRSSDGGATFTSSTFTMQLNAGKTSLAGDRGLFHDMAGRLWETGSAGRSWVLVEHAPTVHSGHILCSEEGCAVNDERRLGWDLPGDGAPRRGLPPPPPAPVRSLVPGAPPLRCTGGERLRIERPLTERGPVLRAVPVTGAPVAIPVEAARGGVDLVLATPAEGRIALERRALFGPAPDPGKTGSRTEAAAFPGGVAATRLTYPVDRQDAAGWRSPVTGQVAFWRPGSGRVVRAELPPLGKGEMEGRFTVGPRRDWIPELLWPSPEGLLYQPYLGGLGSPPLFTIGDDGRVAATPDRSLLVAHFAVRTRLGFTLFEPSSGPSEAAPWPSEHAITFGDMRGSGARGESGVTTWRVAPTTSPPQVEPLARGDDGAVVVAWSGPGEAPAHAFVIPLRAGEAGPTFEEIPLHELLVAHPPICAPGQDEGAARLELPLPPAARRPLLVDGHGPQALELVEAAMVIVPPRGKPCVSAWLVGNWQGPRLVVPVAAPSRSWSMYTEEGLAVLSALRCEEAPGLAIPASHRWEGF